MKILLVGNYGPDRQQSMLRFGDLLSRGLSADGHTVLATAPTSRALALSRRVVGIRTRKWISYVDKYLLFPRMLRQAVASAVRDGVTLVHVVDHSNAVYIPRQATLPWIATCHDLLAVRGALGEDTDCPASRFGRQLQRAIRSGLGRASAIAADSASTLGDVDRIVRAKKSQLRRIILLGLNHPYQRLSKSEMPARVAEISEYLGNTPYLLHVGSNLPRKNKLGVARIFARIASQWPGILVFCGAPLASEVRSYAAECRLSERVLAVPEPTDAQLEALYNGAHALVFPSRSEGFGWPVIEAQACGCPVISSDRTSLPEIGGNASLVYDVNDEAGMAEAVLRLTKVHFRTDVIRRGLANSQRFSTEGMIDAYVNLYEAVCVRFSA